MEAQTLQAEVREKSGKGPARQLRMRGLIPSIYYGPGIDPVKLTVSPESLTKILTGPYRRNQVISLEVGGKKSLALVKDLEIDPVSRDILHADFYSIAEDRAVETTVPFETSGRSHGVHLGGTLRKYYRDLPIRAFPQNVPAAITIDVSDLEIGDELKIGDLVPGEGVTVIDAADRRVVYVDFKVALVEEEEEEKAPAAEAEAATPEE